MTVDCQVAHSDKKSINALCQQASKLKGLTAVSKLWVGLAVQAASGQSRLLADPPAAGLGPQEHPLVGPGACHHLACTVGVVLCFCGP